MSKAEGAELWVRSTTGDVILSVPSLDSGDVVTACMPSSTASSSATITRLADSLWGGRRAVVVEVAEWGRHLQVWCVLVPPGYVQMMGMYVPGPATDDEDNAAMAALAANWRWK